MKLTLWVFLLILKYCQGWWKFGDEDQFLATAQKEIQVFHDNLPALEDQGSATTHNSKSGRGEDETKSNADNGGGKSKDMHDKAHHHESKKQGSSGNEHKKANYNHVIGMKSAHYDEDGDQGSHHKEHGGAAEGYFKDKLSHKKGNYEKGYSDKYHLDEFKHQDKFWSNKDTHEKYRKYGKHGAQHHSNHKADHKLGTHKEQEKENHYGKKGETAKGSHSKDRKGHKSQQKHEQTYSHKSLKGNNRRS